MSEKFSYRSLYKNMSSNVSTTLIAFPSFNMDQRNNYSYLCTMPQIYSYGPVTRLYTKSIKSDCDAVWFIASQKCTTR